VAPKSASSQAPSEYQFNNFTFQWVSSSSCRLSLDSSAPAKELWHERTLTVLELSGFFMASGTNSIASVRLSVLSLHTEWEKSCAPAAGRRNQQESIKFDENLFYIPAHKNKI
jgi:hypothetical protein